MLARRREATPAGSPIRAPSSTWSSRPPTERRSRPRCSQPSEALSTIKRILYMKSRISISYFWIVLIGIAAITMFTARIQAATPPTTVATISGGGAANMDDGEGPSYWGVQAKLLSDGSAQGFFECVDQVGDFFPGNFFGPITSWSRNADGTINLHGSGAEIRGHHPRGPESAPPPPPPPAA